jgi:hypothetical protein
MDEMLDDNAKVFTGKYGEAGLRRDHGGGRDATLAMRAEHELGWMTEEMAAIETVGQEVADSGLPGAPAVADALAACGPDGVRASPPPRSPATTTPPPRCSPAA